MQYILYFYYLSEAERILLINFKKWKFQGWYEFMYDFTQSHNDTIYKISKSLMFHIKAWTLYTQTWIKWENLGKQRYKYIYSFSLYGTVVRFISAIYIYFYKMFNSTYRANVTTHLWKTQEDKSNEEVDVEDIIDLKRRKNIKYAANKNL